MCSLVNRTRAHAVTPRCRRRHHASAVGDPRLPRGRVLILSPIHFVPSPSSSSEQSTRVTLAAARRAGADSGHLSPPCLDSSRCKPRNLALHLLRNISCSIEPSAGRNRSCRPRPPLKLRRAPPLSSSSTFRPPSAQIESPVSFSARLSSFPAISLRDLGAADAGTLLRRRAPPLTAAFSSPAALACALGLLLRARGPPALARPIPALSGRCPTPRRRGTRRRRPALARRRPPRGRPAALRAPLATLLALQLCRLARAAARPSSTAGRPAHGRRARAGAPPCLAGAEQGSRPLSLSLSSGARGQGEGKG